MFLAIVSSPLLPSPPSNVVSPLVYKFSRKKISFHSGVTPQMVSLSAVRFLHSPPSDATASQCSHLTCQYVTQSVCPSLRRSSAVPLQARSSAVSQILRSMYKDLQNDVRNCYSSFLCSLLFHRSLIFGSSLVPQTKLSACHFSSNC